MPTYEYECTACKHNWEAFQKITAGPARKCPTCGKPKARRLLSSGAGFLFKGSGFYTTEYRSDSYKKAAEADKKTTHAAPAEKSTATPAKTDAKPKSSSKKQK